MQTGGARNRTGSPSWATAGIVYSTLAVCLNFNLLFCTDRLYRSAERPQYAALNLKTDREHGNRGGQRYYVVLWAGSRKEKIKPQICRWLMQTDDLSVQFEPQHVTDSQHTPIILKETHRKSDEGNAQTAESWPKSSDLAIDHPTARSLINQTVNCSRTTTDQTDMWCDSEMSPNWLITG